VVTLFAIGYPVDAALASEKNSTKDIRRLARRSLDGNGCVLIGNPQRHFRTHSLYFPGSIENCRKNKSYIRTGTRKLWSGFSTVIFGGRFVGEPFATGRG
jgi:hypothetical protein